MSKIVIAIDSFKGSLTSMEAANAIKKGITNTFPNEEIIIKPLADGGEGTVESLVSGMGGELITCEVTGPSGEKHTATYGKIGKLAIMEMAEAAGITLVPANKRNPLNATTYGVGEMMLHALGLGCNEFIMGIGGSATNDGGIGMLEALGVKFYDASNNELGPYGRDLTKIAKVNVDNLDVRINNVSIKVACDVDNPLCGDSGASAIYGPQKGATPEIVNELDKALGSYANITKEVLSVDYINFPGAGAAGGLGYAFKTYLRAELESGVDIILKEIKLDEDMKGADLVVTGEGCLDFQTAMGKGPIGVAKLGKKHGATVIAFAGGATDDAKEVNNHGIDAYFPIPQRPCTLEEAMDKANAAKNMELTAEQAIRLWKVVK